MLHFLQHHNPKSWQWLRYSRLGFPSLEAFRGKEFQHHTLATNYVFHDLVFQDMNTSEHDCQDLAATTVLKSYIFLSRLGNIPCLELLLFCNSMPPRLDNDCPLSGKDFQHYTLATNYVFHDLVFQDMNTFGNIFQDLAATVLKSYIFSRLWTQVLKCYIFLNPVSPSLDNDCTIQDLTFRVLKLFGVKNFNIIDPCHESCLSWLGLPRHELMWKYVSRLGSHSYEIWHFFKTWNPKFWNVFFGNSMSSSLDNDCTIQDLAFQLLKAFEPNNFNIRPK